MGELIDFKEAGERIKKKRYLETEPDFKLPPGWFDLMISPSSPFIIDMGNGVHIDARFIEEKEDASNNNARPQADDNSKLED